ncbi:hypothetical protein ACP70R_023746 [Stipagrostis hirtigluma subsp. patula]
MDKGKKGGRGYVAWTDDMDEVLLNTFVEYFNKGDRSQNGWKPHVYTAVVKNIREKCRVEITKDNIISRSKTFDKHYAVISNMLATSGFGWDWEKNRVSVDSDKVWEEYVEKHKEASTYRHKVIKFWDSISIVYCKDHATGEASRTASECSKEMTKEDSTTKEDGSTSSASLKRQRSDDSFTSMISKKMDVVVEALKDDGPKGPTADEIRVALDDIPELDEDTYLDLYDILTSNARKFESMMALPMERRRRWLLKQLKK